MSALPKFTEFIRDAATLPGILHGAADDLAADRKAARAAADERFRQEVLAMINAQGLCNLMQLVAQVVDEIADDLPEVTDWKAAHDAIQVCVDAVDLHYEADEPAEVPMAARDFLPRGAL